MCILKTQTGHRLGLICDIVLTLESMCCMMLAHDRLV